VSSVFRRALGALLCVCIGSAIGCDDSGDSEALEVAAGWTEGVDFVWRDHERPRGDFRGDAAECRARLAADPWFVVQPRFNQLILLVGCLEKHGWRRLDGREGGPATRIQPPRHAPRSPR